MLQARKVISVTYRTIRTAFGTIFRWLISSERKPYNAGPFHPPFGLNPIEEARIRRFTDLEMRGW